MAGDSDGKSVRRGQLYHRSARLAERQRVVSRDPGSRDATSTSTIGRSTASLLRQGITPLRFTDFRVEHDIGGILGDLRHFLQIG
jgi:hypothetical protein